MLSHRHRSRARTLRTFVAATFVLVACGASGIPAPPPAPPSTLIAHAPTSWLLLLGAFSDYRTDEVIGELYDRHIRLDYRGYRATSSLMQMAPVQRFLLARAAANFIKRPHALVSTVRQCEQFLFMLGHDSAWGLDGVAACMEDRYGQHHWHWSGRIVRRMGVRARPLVPRIIQILDVAGQVDSMSSTQLVKALGAIGPDAAPAVSTLLRLYESQPNHRFDFIEPRKRSIIETLGRIGPQAGAAGPLLKQIAQHDTPSHDRTAAIVAASRVLPDDVEIQQLVVEGLFSHDLSECAAMAALCVRNPTTFRPLVERRLADEMNSPELETRLRAARALAALFPMKSDTLDSLAMIGARDENSTLRAICIVTIGKRRLTSDDAHHATTAAASDSDSLVRAAAERAQTLLHQ